MAQKGSHYQVASLNRIKTVIKVKLFINFDYKMSRNVFLLIYEHALVILSSYPSTLHCCIKKSFIVRVLHKHVVLFGHWLDFVFDCDFFINVAFVCAFVTWIKDYLLTYLPLSDLHLNTPVYLATHCYHLLSLVHCFTLSSKLTFSENLILHLNQFLSVGQISWL